MAMGTDPGAVEGDAGDPRNEERGGGQKDDPWGQSPGNAGLHPSHEEALGQEVAEDEAENEEDPDVVGRPPSLKSGMLPEGESHPENHDGGEGDILPTNPKCDAPSRVAGGFRHAGPKSVPDAESEALAGSRRARNPVDLGGIEILDRGDLFPGSAVPGLHEEEVEADILDVARGIVAVPDGHAEHPVLGIEDDQPVGGARVAGDLSGLGHGASGVADAFSLGAQDLEPGPGRVVGDESVGLRKKGLYLRHGDRAFALHPELQVVLSHQPGDGHENRESIDLEKGRNDG